MSQQARVPARVVEYFGPECQTRQTHPVITQVFTAEKGWKRTGFNKKVSRSWLEKLRAEGVTSVSLTTQGRTADFTIRELLSLRKTLDMQEQERISAAVRRRASW